jgi:hypothetical protein
MVSIVGLWVPILLSAVIVFIASSVIHMMLPYHRSDYRKLPSEAEAMDALRRLNIPPGDYMMPCPSGPADMRSPEFVEKRTKGPVAVITVFPSGPPAMGKNLVLWFCYSLIVGIIAAYISSRALQSGAHYLKVFQMAGCTAFTAYSLGLMQDSIWYGRSWSTTFRSMFDGLIYGSLTAGVFGWLWPR